MYAREVREKEFKKCLKFLKVKNFEIYKNHCTKFDKYPLSDFVKIIENRIIKFKPDIIVTHNPFDTNIDHKVTYDAVNIACRPSNKFKVKKFFHLKYLVVLIYQLKIILNQIFIWIFQMNLIKN